MRFDSYHVFFEVGIAGSITIAAEKMHISQPAVSKTIKLLEYELGFPLFIRKSKGVNLSEEGKVLFQYIQQAMEQIEAAERMAHQLKNLESGAVRIGISHTLCRHWFLPWLKLFHQSYPQIKIQIFNRTSQDTVQMLYSGDIDFGIISQPFVVDWADFYPLTEIQDIFVTNNKNLLPSKYMSYDELSLQPLMLMEKDNTSREQIEKTFMEQNVPLTADIEISSMDILIEFAKIGLGTAAVIRKFVLEELKNGELYEIPVSPAPKSRWIGILTGRAMPLSHSATAFVEYLKKEVRAD